MMTTKPLTDMFANSAPSHGCSRFAKRNGELCLLFQENMLISVMVKKIMLFCTQNKYWESIEATAICLDESHYRVAAGLFERQFGQSSLLRFTPKVFVFSRIKVEELSQLHDIHLMPLYPLCDISPQEIEQQAPGWAEQIKKRPIWRKMSAKIC
jgi:hypothetical protein